MRTPLGGESRTPVFSAACGETREPRALSKGRFTRRLQIHHGAERWGKGVKTVGCATSKPPPVARKRWLHIVPAPGALKPWAALPRIPPYAAARPCKSVGWARFHPAHVGPGASPPCPRRAGNLPPGRWPGREGTPAHDRAEPRAPLCSTRPTMGESRRPGKTPWAAVF